MDSFLTVQHLSVVEFLLVLVLIQENRWKSRERHRPRLESALLKLSAFHQGHHHLLIDSSLTLYLLYLVLSFFQTFVKDIEFLIDQL